MTCPSKRGWRERLLTAGWFLMAAFAVLPCPAQSQTPDAQAIVQRAIDNRLQADARHRPLRFVWHKKDERRETTREIMESPQGDVGLLLAVNGQRLSAAAQQAEFARLNNLAQHPELQEHRRKREQEDAERVNKLLRLLPTAFLYRIEATEPCGGARVPDVAGVGMGEADVGGPDAGETGPPCFRMSFTPDPRFDPPDAEAKILRVMAGEIWIDREQERLVRLSAHLVSDVDFGWGIVGRLNKGGTIFLEQSDVGGGDWELTRMDLNLAGKVLLVKSLTVRVAEEMGQFAPMPPGVDYRQAIRMLEALPAARP